MVYQGGLCRACQALRSRWSFSASSELSQSRASAARNCCATRIGADTSRYRTRRRSPGSARTSPASASSARCLATACRVTGSRIARSVAVAGPAAASAAKMARRVGSASAANTCSATASASGGIEVGGQLAQLLRPPPGVAVIRPHKSLQHVATERLPYYGNRSVASTACAEAVGLGEPPGKTELCDDAVVEAGHRPDAIAGQRDDQHAVGAEHSGRRIPDVDAESGLPIRPGIDQAIGPVTRAATSKTTTALRAE